jgi:hypothetical protein
VHSAAGFLLGFRKPESTQKKFLATRGIKIQDSKKPNVNHGSKIWMKKPKLDENRFKIGEFLFYIHKVDESRNFLFLH